MISPLPLPGRGATARLPANRVSPYNLPMPYPEIDRLVRSRRRTIALVVTAEARLEVRAPWFTPLAKLQALVEQKGEWIRRKQTEMAARPQINRGPLRVGDPFFLLGKRFELELEDRLCPAILWTDRLTLATQSLGRARELLEAWYRVEARRFLRQRLDHWSGLLGCGAVPLKITGARKRWGSCSPRKGICLSWRLLMAPPAVIDYVVVHELCHLRHPDHSSRFWAAVRATLPDYRQRQLWLGQEGRWLGW